MLRNVWSFLEVTPADLQLRGCTVSEVQKEMGVLERAALDLCLVSKRTSRLLRGTASCKASLTFLTDMLGEYTEHQREFEYNDPCWVEESDAEDEESERQQEMNPLLLDVLFSGVELPCTNHTKTEYTAEVDGHVRQLVRDFPQLLETTFGQMRCRQSVSPLHAACFNTKVPLDTVAYLLESMERRCPHMIQHPIRVNGRKRPILKDLEKCGGRRARVEALRGLFEKHGQP